jgi:ParB-like chromosome segregation protein Spo0J
MIIIKYIKLDLLINNTGQVPGINQNPRDLTEDGFQKTVKSIQDFPEMLDARELVVTPFNNGKYIVIGGNQRLRALKHLEYTEAPCKIVDWSVEEINEFIVKDNLSYGDWNWDLIANEWDAEQLIDWGLELPVKLDNVESEDVKVIEKSTIFGLNIETENKMSFDSIKKELDRLKIGYTEYEK